ncbi:MAG TPA: hypothetical protein VIL92_14325, partial [Gaiellaceae bacterium]
EGAEETAGAVGGIAVQVDLSMKQGAGEIVERAYAEFGELDILVNNAVRGALTRFAAWDVRVGRRVVGPSC